MPLSSSALAAAMCSARDAAPPCSVVGGPPTRMTGRRGAGTGAPARRRSVGDRGMGDPHDGHDGDRSSRDATGASDPRWLGRSDPTDVMEHVDHRPGCVRHPGADRARPGRREVSCADNLRLLRFDLPRNQSGRHTYYGAAYPDATGYSPGGHRQDCAIDGGCHRTTGPQQQRATKDGCHDGIDRRAGAGTFDPVSDPRGS